MTPVQRRRLVWVLLALLASGLATALVAMALERNIAYLYTPSEVLRGDVDAQSRFRLGGMVVKGSFNRPVGSLEARFEVTDGDAQLAVTTSRILPDMFAEGTAVVASGRRTAPSSPTKCWPSTMRSTCRRKWPTRWATPIASTTCR